MGFQNNHPNSRWFIYLTSLTLLLNSCEKAPPRAIPPAPVVATKVTKQTIPAIFEYIGVAESSHIVELRARVEGYLEAITYKEGSLVQEGDLMFVLDQRPFQAALDFEKGMLDRQEALLWNAEQTLNRMVPLYKQNAVSKKDLDDATASKLASQADVVSAKANVEKAALNLSFASIKAPVTGMTNQAKFREGALISPGPDSLLTTIYVIDPIWVNFNISEFDLLKARNEVHKGLLKYPDEMNFDIEVVLVDNTVLPSEGKIDFADPALQQNTGTMVVRAVVPNSETLLRPGQFVRVRLKGATRPDAIIVPQTAVQQGQNGTFVYVIDQEGKAAIRLVETGDWYEDFWIINSGLQEGDSVIVQGVNKVQNGSAVNVKSWVPDAPSPKKPRVTSH